MPLEQLADVVWRFAVTSGRSITWYGQALNKDRFDALVQRGDIDAARLADMVLQILNHPPPSSPPPRSNSRPAV